MARFKFFAMDSGGNETEGVLEADNQSQAVAMIRAKGLFPTKVSEIGGRRKQAASGRGSQAAAQQGQGLKMEIKLPGFLGPRVKAKQLMIFTRQLATLVDAGLPLLRGIRILLKQEKNSALRKALTEMGESVEGGSTFSEALEQHPRIFDNLFINMVRAGEAGGVLEVVLNRLAEFMEKAERIKNKIKSAMIYPVVVLVAAVGILTFLMIYVIPRFKEIFNDLLGDEGLPILTEVVIAISNFIARQWYVFLGFIVGFIFLYKILARTDRGRFIVDKIKLKMPLFGQLFTKSAVARFSRTLGTLMTSGVPVLQALNIVRDTSGNRVLSDAIQAVHDNVKEGEDMSTPLEHSRVFPGMVISMVDVGEETGALPEMLLKIADTYEDEVDTAVEGLTSIIEPIMIVLLAGIVGTIVIAMFVPLIHVVSTMAG